MKNWLNILNIHNNKVKLVLADGAYDSNENCRFLNDKIIRLVIKVKRNSIISSKSNKMRNREVRHQTKDLLT